MDQYEFIRTAHRVYGKSISDLSRQTGHSRNTIKKAIRAQKRGQVLKNQLFPSSFFTILLTVV
jgi:lambda repressor-like predicted transcriptional regulator